MLDWATVMRDHLAAVHVVARSLPVPRGEHLVLALDPAVERGALTIERLGLTANVDLVVTGLAMADLWPLIAGGRDGATGVMVMRTAAQVMWPDQAVLAVGAECLEVGVIDVPPATDWELN